MNQLLEKTYPTPQVQLLWDEASLIKFAFGCNHVPNDDAELIG